MIKSQHYIDHLYGVLQEEAAELIQAISKRRRFGDNLKDINHELNDILAVVEMLALEGEPLYEDYGLQTAKEHKVNKFYADTLEKDMSWNEFFSDKVPDHHSGTI